MTRARRYLIGGTLTPEWFSHLHVLHPDKHHLGNILRLGRGVPLLAETKT
jgi:hypothetical protein